MSDEESDLDSRLDAGAAGHRFIRGAGFRVLGYVVGIGMGALVTPLVTRHLGAVDWGRYVTVSSVLFITVAIIEGGLANMGVREFSTRGRTGRDEYMSGLIGLRIVLCSIGAAGALGFSLLVGYDSVLLGGVAIGCVGMLFSTLQATLAIALTSRLRLGWQSLVDFSGQAVSALALLSLVLLRAPLLPFFVVTTLVATVTLAVTHVLIRGDLTVRLVWRPTLWRSLLAQSGLYAGAAALGVVYFQVVAVAITLLTNGRQTGYFDLGFRVLSLLNGIPWLLVTAAFPILSRAAQDDHGRLQFAHQSLVEVGTIVGGWVSVSLVVGAPVIVTIIGGPQFDPSVEVVRIVGAGVIGTYLLATWSFIMLSLSLFRQLIVTNACAVALAIGLSWALIPSFGADGAAVVTAALEVALAGGYLLALVRARPHLRPRLAPILRIIAVLVVALAASAFTPVPSFVKVLIETAVLAVLLWRTGAIPPDLSRVLLRKGQAPGPLVSPPGSGVA